MSECKHESYAECIDSRTGNTVYVCDECDRVFKNKCEIYSRVVGYLRPVSGWNLGKQAEFSTRKPYEI